MDVQKLLSRLAVPFTFSAVLLGLSACEPATGFMPEGVDYIRVMWNGDAARSATVAWSYPDTIPVNQKLYYSVTDHGRKVEKYERSVSYSKTKGANDIYHAFARLKDLTPDTKYYFVISDGKESSERYWFKTASDRADERVSLISGGDSRNSRTVRQDANRLVAKLRVDAVMFDGDMTMSGSPQEWRDWFEDWQLSIASDGRVTPLIMARGNHEASNAILVDLFDAPAGNYYAVKIGGGHIRVYTLNSEASVAGTQTEWLKAELARDVGTTWQLAQYHSPMRPHVSSKADGTNQYRYWAPLFHQYGVDVVAECDAHTVKSTWPIRPSTEAGSTEGFIRDDKSGTVYIGEGGWGAPLRKNNKVRPWTRDSGMFNHFNWIFINGRELEIRTVKIENADRVAELKDETRFQIPANLALWAPANGAVVKVTR